MLNNFKYNLDSLLKVSKNLAVLITLIFFLFTKSFLLSQNNPGLENNTSLAGWAANATPNNGINTTNSARSGGKAIVARWSSSTATTADVQHNGGSITVPGAGYYVHVIAWTARGSTSVSTGIGVKNTSTGAQVNTALASNAAYTRNTVTSAISTASHSYVPVFRASNSNSIGAQSGLGDDFIIYASTQSTTDVTAPNAPTNLCVNKTGNNNVLTWSDGTDAASNLNGVMILRAPFGTALPTVRNQAYYSTNYQTGPNFLHSNWTVLSNSVAPGSQTFEDIGAATTPYIYAVYMRDIAYNYSAPISFSTAHAGPDQSLCSVTSATMSPSAVPSGYTGNWTLLIGGGTFSSSTSITSIPTGTNEYLWTVSNGAGCTTSDAVIVQINTTAPTAPTLLTPASGSTISPSPVNLMWNNSGNASTYVVQLGTSSPPGTSFPSQIPNSYNAGTLNPATTYYWRVNATNACGTTTGAIWNFITQPVFSATATGTEATCGTGWDSGNSYTGFVKTIAVSGLPTPLGTASGQYVLNEVEVNLGSSTCKRDLSTYDFRLTAPDGTYLDFFPTNKLTGSTTAVWVRVKFRDHDALEMINQYPVSYQDDIHPYSIGYYSIQTVDGFLTTFNGRNPNGNWQFAILENTSDEIAFNSVTLKFGPKILVNNIKDQVYYDNCSTSQCMDSRQVTVATNEYLVNGDPILTSTNPNGSCFYNGASHNSGWFSFKAAGNSAYLTVSGMMGPGQTGNNQMQLVVIQRPAAGCVDQGGSWIIPTGGCIEGAGNSSYLTTNGGGGASHSNGITGNVEFNLTGLSAGTTYYLNIDGNSGATSPFYIEGLNGFASCDEFFLLPIELLSFDAKLEDKVVALDWISATERNNDFYIVERSTNGFDWEFVDKIDGAGNSSQNLSYVSYDFNPLLGASYYRLKQKDFDGKTTILGIRSIENADEISVYPNPNTGVFSISGLPNRVEKQITLLDITGQKVSTYYTEDDNFKLDISNQASGIYFVYIEGFEPIKIIKQ
jgi:hypothetical protein